ncbi:MAG: hypothetical protein ACP5MD_00625 [Verrucomicrobiia bacterium]
MVSMVLSQISASPQINPSEESLADEIFGQFSPNSETNTELGSEISTPLGRAALSLGRRSTRAHQVQLSPVQ